MIKRYVFDLDGTLMTGDYSKTDNYFVDIYGTQAYDLSNNMGHYLSRYERMFERYDIDTLSKYLSMKSNLPISPRVIREWIEAMDSILDMKEEEVGTVLESLKSNDKSLVVLTNWFGRTQIPRLERAGLLDYFDEVYSGDQVLKPHKKAYYKAAGEYNVDEVVFIGDNTDFDYIGPKSCGYDAILYDKKDIQHETIRKVKKLGEILTIE